MRDWAQKRNPTQNLLRLTEIGWVLLKEYRVLRRFVLGVQDDGAPVRFAKRLVKLGPVLLKLGQILSTRPDVLPRPYVDTLSNLQENGPKLSIKDIHLIVERELGKPIEQLFAKFDETPVAKTSLAQVHWAKLPDGTDVAVKVQRPNLERFVGRDLDAMQFGLRWLYRLAPRSMQRTNLKDFFAECRRYTFQELDFCREARVIDRFRVNFTGRADVKFPTVHWSHTSQRVLTLDWVEGLRLREAASSLGTMQKEQLVTFPFGAPSYKWRDVLTTDGVIAFDCSKCPVAEFFGYDASELCVQSWCRLDFPLADKWGGQLQRTGTIASGAAKCDFRWRPQDPVDLRSAAL